MKALWSLSAISYRGVLNKCLKNPAGAGWCFGSSAGQVIRPCPSPQTNQPSPKGDDRASTPAYFSSGRYVLCACVVCRYTTQCQSRQEHPDSVVHCSPLLSLGIKFTAWSTFLEPGRAFRLLVTEQGHIERARTASAIQCVDLK